MVFNDPYSRPGRPPAALVESAKKAAGIISSVCLLSPVLTLKSGVVCTTYTSLQTRTGIWTRDSGRMGLPSIPPHLSPRRRSNAPEKGKKVHKPATRLPLPSECSHTCTAHTWLPILLTASGEWGTKIVFPLLEDVISFSVSKYWFIRSSSITWRGAVKMVARLYGRQITAHKYQGLMGRTSILTSYLKAAFCTP